MTRTVAVIIAVMFTLLFAFVGVAQAGVVGFSETHEFTAPPLGPLDPGTRPAERGTWEYWSTNNFMEQDPSCTSSKVLMMDASQTVAEVHAVFTHLEKYGVSETKVDLGVENPNVRSLRVGIYTGESTDEVPIIEYLGNGVIEVFGQIQDDIGYQNVWAGDCALGEDNRQTIVFSLNFEDWEMTAELTTRENGTTVVREYGPITMPDQLSSEGLQEVRFYAPGGSGKMLVDGMVCTEAFLPPESETGSRSSSWRR